ncbi:Sortilin-related receptor [Holothuria leucospilota]|uniref:Sortilin-related receptor n=1 Tax=Holothuria leucospilota TaxID=206669 RepID=A0A9Q0YT84_HOLLE|nr:Sortilin-related receptor [Holothuria leucospilota]
MFDNVIQSQYDRYKISYHLFCNKYHISRFEVRAGCYYGNGTDYMDTGEFTINGYRCVDWEEVANEVFDSRMYPDIGTDDYLQEFRRYPRVTFDITSYRYLDIGNQNPDTLSEAVCAKFCIEEQSFTCRSYTMRSFLSKNVTRYVLQGNFESRCARLVEFDPRIYAESIRVLPLSSHGNPGMKFELLGCKDGCDFSTGLTDLQAHDASITASSALRSAHNPREARIQPLAIQSEVRLGWSPDVPSKDAEPWIQISYPELQVVKAVITQGCPLSDAYMESFILYYTDEQDADDEDDIYPFRDPSTGDAKVFTANSNPEALVRNDLPYEITAMFVRLIAITWGGSGHPCMKFEIIGCPYKICGSPLKVGTGDIGEVITITGRGKCTPESFVLNGPSTQGSYETSISTPRIVMSYLEIQLFDEYSITAIVTQGTLNNNGEWATKFSMEYARNVNDGFGFDYRPYDRTNGQTQVFEANKDSITPVINQLDRPISATKLKITYYNDMLMSITGPCIRLDLMGCKVSERGFPCGPGGLKSSGYCMGIVTSRDSDPCATVFHYSSGLAVLSNPSIVDDVNIQLRQILLEGFSHYLIGLQQSSNLSSESFVWQDGTPLLYPENFDSDLDIDFSSTPCVVIDVLDEFSWKALPCLSPELSAASLCQFDIDECLQETNDCSDGCINYPGGFLCSCPHGSYLDTHEQHNCESLCDVLQMDTISSMPNACLEFHPDASFKTAEEVCQQSRSRLLNADEFQVLLPEWRGKFTTHRVWIKREDPQDFHCYIAEVDVESNEVETVIVDCKTNNTFVCIMDDLPQTFNFNTSESGYNYFLTDNTLYLTWTGLPPWYDSMSSASLDIRVQDNQIVRIYFVNIILRLNDGGRCLDKLTLWENLISGGRNMQGEYCGNLFGFNLESVTNHVTLTLQIGELRRNLPRYLTLQLLYEGRDCSLQKCNVYCESSGLNITEPQGQLQTFNFPEFLPPYYSCVWTIQLPKGSFVKLTFQEVAIPCIQNSFIKVFSRQQSNSQLLDETTFSTLCEHPKAWTISETNKLIISYSTGLNQQSGGFDAIYETTDTPGCRLEPKEGMEDICSLTECTFPRAYVASPSYPLLVSEPLICLWKIKTSPKSFIYFQIIDINVQDGPACDINFVLIQEESRNVQLCGLVHHQLPVYISERNAIDVQISHLNVYFLAAYEERTFVSSTPVVLGSDSGYTCPDGWHLFDRRCFVIRSEDNFLRWTEALLSCLNETESSNLASIRNKAEMNFIHSLILNGNHNPTTFYIGLFRDPEMDDYRWTDGSPLSYTDWYSRRYDYLNMQPEGSRTEACTAIQMKSFRATDNWFEIPCAERTTDSFICSKPASHPACNIGYHLFGEICVKLVPLVHSVEVNDLCPSGGGTASLHFLMLNLQKFEYYLSYVWHTPEDAAYIGIIVIASNITNNVLCFEREQLGTFQVSHGSCSVEDIFILCGRDATDLFQNCSSSQFRCGLGECLNTAFVCDFVFDCQDRSDEVGCSTKMKDNEVAVEECLPNNFQCNDGTCIQISFACDFVNNCPDNSDETNCEYPTCESHEAECTNKQCIPSEKWCDLIPDCADGSDESFCDYLQANFTCDASLQILCKNGACADKMTVCLMDHDKYGIVKGCRDLTHLQYCDLFDCPDFFYKCPNSYCIPQHYRCDAKKDCPGGEDEVNCENYSCQGAYKCRGSRSCLAQRHVCDTIPQCPEEDDEFFCGMLFSFR